MKKLISSFLILTILCSLFSFIGVFAEEVVIFSDSFENGMDNWSYVNAKDGGKFSYPTTEKATDGKSSIIIKDTDEKTYGFISKEIPCDAGETYTYSYDGYLIEGSGSFFVVGYFTEDGKRTKADYLSTSKVGEWVSLKKEFKVPEDTKYIRIYFTGSGAKTGSNYVDNIKVTGSKAVVTGTDADPNLGILIEDSFETGMDKWNYVASKDNGTFSYPTSDKATDGKLSIVVIDKDDKTYGYRSNKIPVQAGVSYTYQYDMFLEEGIAAQLIIGYFDAEDKRFKVDSFRTSTLNEWVSLKKTFAAPEGTSYVMFYFTGTGADTGKTYIDNFKVTYDKRKVMSDTEIKLDQINKSSIALFLGSANALVNGSKTLIDKANDKVIADTVDGRTLVPVRFIAENYGAEVGWDDATQTVTLKMTDKVVTIVLNKNEIDINGSKITIDVPAQTIEGRTMLPLRAFVENVMGKTIFWDDRGLIVITDTPILDAATDAEIINTIINNIK